MHEQDVTPELRKRHAKTLAMTTLAGAVAVALALPSVASADPEPSPTPNPPPSGNTFLQGPPGDPNAPPPPADPNAPPPVADPNAAPADPNAAPAAPAPPPEPGRVDNAAGGFSYVVPAGWKVADARQLSYGQALLTKIGAEGATPQQQPPQPGQQQQPGQETPQPVNDTSILLGRLDMKLFAGAEADNGKAATRLASDMGEFFMPFPGTRVNQQNGSLTAGDMPGAFSSYDVKFTDTNKPVGQIWAGVVGNATLPASPGQPLAPRGQRNERWFVVWLGSANNPIDKGAATALASSIRPWTPPPPPEPDPNAPPAPNVTTGPNAPQQRPEVGVARPVDPGSAPPEMGPPPPPAG
jgi:hypothetical protein